MMVGDMLLTIVSLNSEAYTVLAKFSSTLKLPPYIGTGHCVDKCCKCLQ
jgi:hypothetical protein